MMLECLPVLEQLSSSDETPISMSDCESLENICDYEGLYHHRARVEELRVLKMDKKLPKFSNKCKRITKIFKDKTFSPSLEDIKEVEERINKDDCDTPYFLSMPHVHYERALHSGFADYKDKGRRFRNEYWKSYHRGQTRASRRSVSW